MKKKLLIVAGALMVLIALFFYLKPQSTPKTSSQSPAAQSNQKTFTLEFDEGVLVIGDKTLKVDQGTKVTIKATSDKADELHLHGYDKELELEPATQGTMTLTADKAGRFTIELHSTDTEVAALEVQPKP